MTASHAFLVWLNVEEYVESEAEKKIRFLRTVRDARSVPMDEVHAMYDNAFAMMQSYNRDSSAKISAYDSLSAYQALERAFGDRPGLLRIATIDEYPSCWSTPLFNLMPTDLDAEWCGMIKTQKPSGHEDWLNVFKARIASEEFAWKTASREAALKGWIHKQGPNIVGASMHALNLRKQPERIGQYAQL